MAKKVMLGLVEQPIMRKEELTPEEERQITEILSQVNYVEGKYLGTLQVLRKNAERLGGIKTFLLHVQYPTGGGREILNLLSPNFKEDLSKETFTKILQTIDPEWYSLHLGFSCEYLTARGQFDFIVGDSEVLDEAVCEKGIIENMAYLQENFSTKGRPLLENLDYNPREVSGVYEYVCEPEFIGRILEKTGCGMLLDLCHAVVSARNMGYGKDWDYIEKLPLEEVVEVHIAGAGEKDGLAHDTHRPINAPGQREVEYFEKFLKSGRCGNFKAVSLETFEDVVPQLKLLQKTLGKSGFEVG